MKIYDVLVIGGGGAGLTTALKLKNLGGDVVVVSKSSPPKSGTTMAQGGINSVSGDEIKKHIEETLISGAGLSKVEAVKILAEESEKAIAFLKDVGVPIAKDKRRLGGVSSNRANHVKDYTGLSIVQRLYEKAQKSGVEFRDNLFLLNYILESGEIYGATFLNIEDSSVVEIFAKSVVVATGGYSQIYRNFSTNSTESTGDGVATHIRNGGTLSNLEFIQFHPTAIKGKGILISETARGEGGILVNSRGKRFVDELLSRDIVAREIYSQIERGENVFLDLRPIKNIREKMPQEVKLIESYTGLNPENSPIPIEPVAHYTMGGIATNRFGESSISGVFAVGEVAQNGVHGGNRLGGNSLLELIVFGGVVAEKSLEFAKSRNSFNPKSIQAQKDRFFIDAIFRRFTNQLDFFEKREFLGKILYRNGGIFRDEMGLKGVLSIVRQYERELPFMGVTDKSKFFNRNLVQFIEFGNMVELAEVILVGAINRFESRGSHFRVDYPKRDERNFQNDTIMWKVEGILTTEFGDF
jgi:succinate dehydrogenase / fumarate reductase flavoprotein subunit